jgi:hypothetical protein
MHAGRENPMRLGTTCIAIAILAGLPAIGQAGRYELVPEPEVRQTSSNRVTSAYVVDKKANQFWICTARYHFQDLTANNWDCVKLAADIGTTGEVQFCAIRHAGLCVRMTLP